MVFLPASVEIRLSERVIFSLLPISVLTESDASMNCNNK